MRWVAARVGGCGWVMSHVWMSHMHESCRTYECHICTSRVTCNWVTAHMHESWHTRCALSPRTSVGVGGCMSHVTRMNESYAWVMSHIFESRHICMSHGTPDADSRRAIPRELECFCLSQPPPVPWVTSDMNECYIWMSRVAYAWVMSHMNESCHMWMSHVTYEWFMSHMNESCPIWIRSVPYVWVMSRLNESCRTCANPVAHECMQSLTVMSHMNGPCPTWMSHVPYEWSMSHKYVSCLTWMHAVLNSHVPHEWVMSHMDGPCPIWMSHVPYEWVMSHMHESCPIWMLQVPHEWVMSPMNESCPTWMSRVPHEWVIVCVGLEAGGGGGGVVFFCSYY